MTTPDSSYGGEMGSTSPTFGWVLRSAAAQLGEDTVYRTKMTPSPGQG